MRWAAFGGPAYIRQIYFQRIKLRNSMRLL